MSIVENAFNQLNGQILWHLDNGSGIEGIAVTIPMMHDSKQIQIIKLFLMQAQTPELTVRECLNKLFFYGKECGYAKTITQTTNPKNAQALLGNEWKPSLTIFERTT